MCRVRGFITKEQARSEADIYGDYGKQQEGLGTQPSGDYIGTPITLFISSANSFGIIKRSNTYAHASISVGNKHSAHYVEYKTHYEEAKQEGCCKNRLTSGVALSIDDE